MKVRRHYTFNGYVQGVGFRWRARFAADAHNCTGWVENKWDGSVEMEIQGEEADIDEVIEEIRDGSYIEIRDMETSDMPLEKFERRFRVRG